ncbi:hypothetical protein M8C21_026749 [Ambrosia artemisiifolia]|uniref:Cathepsin propeptide inhibitor domain-containing protein n=1 Tax=Ambrosia artemisiifolia TaxID=4212 RepID=A0AAD5GLY3_AMBAR|nr:hypothetical protein M8C21_026749 [Ambrosia artemisiifolia]
MAMQLKKMVPLQRRLLWINNQSRDYRRRRSVQQHASDDDVKDLFEEWAIDYNRVYETVEEKELRFLMFKERYRRISEHNMSGAPHKLGLNTFADNTPAESRMRSGSLAGPVKWAW